MNVDEHEKMLQDFAEKNPDMSREEIEEMDRALDDYINVCRELFWDKVVDGTFEFPESEEEESEADKDASC